MGHPDLDPFARVCAADPIAVGSALTADEAETLAQMRARILSEPRTDAAPRRGARRTRGLLVGAAIGAALVAVLVVIALTRSSAPSSPAVRAPAAQPVFSVLGEPGTAVLHEPGIASSSLPAWIRTNPTLHELGVDPASGRLAVVSSGRSYYVARTTDGAAICLIDAVLKAPTATYQPGDPGGVTCRYTDGHTQTFAQGFVRGFLAVVLHENQTDDTALIGGVVPDGFTQVRIGNLTSRVANNVYLVPGAEPWRPIVATGPGGVRTVWLGIAPPQPVPGKGTPLGVVLFSQPPVLASQLPRFVRNSLRDPPTGRHAWLAADLGGLDYWVLTTGKRGAPVVTTITTADAVSIGSTVTVRRLGSTATSTFLVVEPPGGPSWKSAGPGTQLPDTSALGAALVGHRTGDVVSVTTAGHLTRYLIVSFDPGDGNVGGGSWPTTTMPMLASGSGGTVSASGQQSVARWSIAGLVADGYTTLSGGGVTAQVHHNFVWLPGIETDGPAIPMTLSGPAGQWQFYVGGPGVLGAGGSSGSEGFGRIALDVPYG
jgi:hypothetical protein